MHSTPASMTGMDWIDGLMGRRAFLEGGGSGTTLRRRRSAIQDDMFDPRLMQTSAQGIQGIVEGAEHNNLLSALEDLVDEGEGAGELGNVGKVAAGIARGVIADRALQEEAGGIGRGHTEGLELGAQSRLAILVEVFSFQVILVNFGLSPAHWDADDMAVHLDEFLAAIGLAPAQDDGGEQLP